MKFKNKSKIIGWDDGPFKFDQEEPVPVVGAITRGGGRLDGLLKTGIEKDGLNGTARLAEAINESKHRRDLSLVALDGITFAGFNVIDIKNLAEKTGIPVLAVTRKRVDIESFRSALSNLPEFKRRWQAVKNAGKIGETEIRGSRIFYQTASFSFEEAERVISLTASHSVIPEPVRLADLISRAIVLGES
jgi:hypothetical protein